MTNLFEQGPRVHIEKSDGSRDFAAGYLEGEYSRRCGARLSAYSMVGLDDYCLGLRAGYFGRGNPTAARAEIQAAPSLQRTRQ